MMPAVRTPLPILLGTLLAMGACGGPASPWGDAPERIVLVTIDTLRADHVSAFGHPIRTTPFFDSLASEGVLFRRAYAHSATTKPSHSSMFTSLYPMQHAVVSNGLVLDLEFRTLAEMMRDRGYRTAAFVSTDAPLGGNLNQGFDVWNQHSADAEIDGGRSEYRPAEQTVNAALEWLAGADPADKLFLWVHVYDPHKPLQPPDGPRNQVLQMVQAFGEQAYADELARRGVPGHVEEGLAAVVDYDAEILYADQQLQRLFETMSAGGWNERALWVLTSDHGQGLGAHDWFGHSKQIYNAQLHVPLLFWFSAGIAPLVIDNRIVEHVDLLPTIAQIVGASVDQILSVQGQSLVPLLTGERARNPKWFAFSERSRYVDPSRRRQERGNYEPGARYSLQDLEYKYLLFTEGADEFYDLTADPYETTDLIDAEEYADRRDQILAALLEMIQTMPSDREAEEVSAEDIERLRALGYIQ